MRPRRSSTRRIAISAIATAACLALASSAHAQETGVAGDDELSRHLEEIRTRYDVPGLAVLTVHGEEVLEQGTTGLRVAGSGSPVMPTDRWHLGSLTKAMTSTVAAVLVERGVVAWNTTVGDVFPGPRPSIRPEYQSARLDALLSHITGLPNDNSRAVLGDARGRQ